MFEQGWIGRQTDRIDVDAATWPEWMRSPNWDANLTTEQRKQAAAILRKWADELEAFDAAERK